MKDFTQGKVTSQIIMFTLPMLAGNLFQQFYSMADAAVVGHYIGGSALAAVGNGGILINFLLSIVLGLTTGASVLISQLYGAGKHDELKRAVSTSVIFLTIVLFVIMLVGIIFSPLFLRLLDVPEDIFDSSVLYLRIIMGGLLFMLFYNVYSAYLRALGDSKNPLYFLIIASLLNVGLDILFVAAFGMGIAGVAIATVIAQTVAAVLCFIYVERKVPYLQIHRLVFDKSLLRAILKYSIPAAVQLSIVSLAWLTIQRLINGFGSTSIAGFTAATKIDSFATLPLSSISAAISTFVAQNMGAGLVPRAKKGFYSSMAMSVGLGICISIIAFLFGRYAIQAFVSSSDPNYAEIVGVGISYLNIIAASYTLFAVFFSLNGFFRGAGDAVVVMVLTITSLTLRSVTAHILVLGFGMGPEAVAYSIPVGWGTCSLLAFVYYKRNMWAGKMAVKTKEKPDENQNEPTVELT